MLSKKPARFTAQFVAGLSGGERPVDFTDPAVRGLQIRTLGTLKTWLFRFKRGEKSVRIRIGRYPEVSLAEAREKAISMRKLLDHGMDPRTAQPYHPRSRALGPAQTPPGAGPVPRPHSIEFLVEEFVEKFVKVNNGDPTEVRRKLNKDVLPYWEGRDARTIKPREIIEVLDRIVDRGAKVMANRVATLLRKLFLFGVQRAIVESNPVQLLYRPGGKEPSRRRRFDDQELRAFLLYGFDAARTQTLGHILRILLLTAARRGELCRARWRDVDLVKRQWTIPEEVAKNRIACLIPLTDMAIADFTALRSLAGDSEYVLPAKVGNGHVPPKYITRRVARCQRRFAHIGIGKFVAHDLRRTCRTYLSRLAVNQLIAEQILNHKRRGMEGVYDLYEFFPQKRRALEKWDTFLSAIIAESQTRKPVGQPVPGGRILSDSELEAFVRGYRKAARTKALGHILKILLLTAASPSELSATRWSDVDLADRMWLIPENAGEFRNARLVPLSDEAVQEFFGLISTSQRRDFLMPLQKRNAPVDRKYLPRRIRRCQRRFLGLGIDQLEADDLRRTCAAHLLRDGVASDIVNLILSGDSKGDGKHADLHARLPEKRVALEHWAVFIRSLESGRQAGQSQPSELSAPNEAASGE